MNYISVVIINFNGSHFLDDCFNSISKNIKLEHEIIVFDNNSSDDSVKFIETNYPNVKLIKSSENIGFGKGNNLAVRESNGDYILLLNNDTQILTNINEAIIALENNDKFGIISGKMLGKNKEYRLSSGYFPDLLRLFKISSLYIKKGDFLKGNFKDEDIFFDVDWVEGSFMILKKAIWEKVEGFSSNYFMYGEDLDLCKKVKLLNYKVIYYPKIKYIHYGGYNSSRIHHIFRGLLEFQRNHTSSFTFEISKFIINIGMFFRYIVFNFISIFSNSNLYHEKAKSCKSFLNS